MSGLHQRDRLEGCRFFVCKLGYDTMRALQLVSDREVKAVDIDPPAEPLAGEVQLKIKVVALNHLDVWG